ncbi:hypothetical protein FCL47_13170 [Desulfopila sp. IMCC35006]|uniref:hypothetical protein n=1 Tax=Desulfopila sp. IMCC35006 TaxID=2569542 RepID=UPI0010ACDEBA|nr:hypothetical protein [Desulfopila sp. IMCC35006]TKB25488.1 hypothetical protein FCL47_13170 [Desulfopila sp. IMCC35006]
MKKIIMLAIVMMTMLVSLGGCYVVPFHDRGRGHDLYWNGGYNYDRGRGGHDRNRGYDYDRRRGGHERHWDGEYNHNRY